MLPSHVPTYLHNCAQAKSIYDKLLVQRRKYAVDNSETLRGRVEPVLSVSAAIEPIVDEGKR